MIIFRFNLLLVAAVCASPVTAQGIDLTPRSPLEGIVLEDAEAVRDHLTALALRARDEREVVVAELLAAGFVPERGMPGCAFYGYHRRTTQDGAARSVQLALCDEREPMVLVLDFLPPAKRGGGIGTSGEGSKE